MSVYQMFNLNNLSVEPADWHDTGLHCHTLFQEQ
jgi:hypothetical protein